MLADIAGMAGLLVGAWRTHVALIEAGRFGPREGVLHLLAGLALVAVGVALILV